MRKRKEWRGMNDINPIFPIIGPLMHISPECGLYRVSKLDKWVVPRWTTVKHPRLLNGPHKWMRAYLSEPIRKVLHFIKMGCCCKMVSKKEQFSVKKLEEEEKKDALASLSASFSVFTFYWSESRRIRGFLVEWMERKKWVIEILREKNEKFSSVFRCSAARNSIYYHIYKKKTQVKRKAQKLTSVVKLWSRAKQWVSLRGSHLDVTRIL
ncbi:hypothetical protein B9Z55_014615 [Caenorhabditis nigoni]|uniref:Uncharacterized protein n=1 Tax=Caenorhabditis nigoni TaxID=1611254 RepID=A0A2G5U6L3_9PELO|nr:hypothetical protein B9Z55_014615 [Caenorhabditis nigoni]